MDPRLPDDWDSYWTTCPDCGKKYHMSEWCEYCEDIEEDDDNDDNEDFKEDY